MKPLIDLTIEEFRGVLSQTNFIGTCIKKNILKATATKFAFLAICEELEDSFKVETLGKYKLLKDEVEKDQIGQASSGALANVIKQAFKVEKAEQALTEAKTFISGIPSVKELINNLIETEQKGPEKTKYQNLKSFLEKNTTLGDEIVSTESIKIEKKLRDLIIEGNIKQIILTGAPGTGKTHSAKQIAKSIVSEENNPQDEEEINEYIEFVQFHPSYDYTDFVAGLRPFIDKSGIPGFKPEKGIIWSFCDKAKDFFPKKCFFIIDEINRGDLSKIFGELMYGLEENYRGQDIDTQYSKLLGEQLVIPNNVYIIGTMNDIDRSVEAFDFALRRRFMWLEIKANDVMETVLEGKKVNEKLSSPENFGNLVNSAKRLNDYISTEGAKFGLNESYHLGPDYFSKLPYLSTEKQATIKEIKKHIWEYRVEPILREYCRGRGSSEAIKTFIENCSLEFYKTQDTKQKEKKDEQ